VLKQAKAADDSVGNPEDVALAAGRSVARMCEPVSIERCWKMSASHRLN